MVVLSDRDLIKAVKSGIIVIEPFDESAVGPCSVDLSLGTSFRVFKKADHTHIDPREGIPGDIMDITEKTDKPFIIHPGEFILASIKEKIRIPNNMIARLEGRSSWGRLGIIIHSTAGKVDPGFEGNLTLEIANISSLPVALWPGTRIAQLTFEMLSSPAEMPYNQNPKSKYLHEKTPSISKLDEESAKDESS